VEANVTALLASLDRLPPFPPVALRTIQALSSDQVETGELTRLVSADPVLASEILQAANSALFGLPRQVTSLRHAIVLVGREYLRPLLFTAALRAYLKAPGRNRLFRAWWRHSLASALLGDGLAAATGRNRGLSYTAGLLHDIGRLGLMMAAGPENYGKPDAPDRERSRLGLDHCQAGEILLVKWGLPAELAAAAAHHHSDYEDTAEAEPPVLISLACRLATSLGFWTVKPRQSCPPDQILGALPTAWAWMRKLDPEQLRESLEQRIHSYELS
jgi:HD-like signal output (HDOD) protein